MTYIATARPMAVAVATAARDASAATPANAIASGHAFANPAAIAPTSTDAPATAPAMHVMAAETARTSAHTPPVAIHAAATSGRRPIGSVRSTSRCRRSSAAAVAATTQRTARKATASGTMRLSISTSTYAARESSSSMPNALFSAGGYSLCDVVLERRSWQERRALRAAAIR